MISANRLRPEHRRSPRNKEGARPPGVLPRLSSNRTAENPNKSEGGRDLGWPLSQVTDRILPPPPPRQSKARPGPAAPSKETPHLLQLARLAGEGKARRSPLTPLRLHERRTSPPRPAGELAPIPDCANLRGALPRARRSLDGKPPVWPFQDLRSASEQRPARGERSSAEPLGLHGDQPARASAPLSCGGKQARGGLAVSLRSLVAPEQPHRCGLCGGTGESLHEGTKAERKETPGRSPSRCAPRPTFLGVRPAAPSGPHF